MKQVQFIPPTKRTKMTKARSARIFLAANGICHICGCQIRDGEAWDVEHPDALALGGSDKDEDLRPVHAGKRDCHKDKTAHDRRKVADRNRAISKGYVGNAKRKQPMPGSRASKWKRRMDGTVVER